MQFWTRTPPQAPEVVKQTPPKALKQRTLFDAPKGAFASSECADHDERMYAIERGNLFAAQVIKLTLLLYDTDL